MNKHLIILGFAAIAALAGVVSAGDYSGGGAGTEADPYRIATAADMNEIGAHTEDWGSHFVMVNDINLADYTGTEFNIIGNYSDPFTGVFDGNCHTISNFTYNITDTDDIGFFGYVDDVNAVIKNLTLVDPNVKAAGRPWYPGGWRVGCLVGRLRFGTVTGCGIEGGSTSGFYSTGGLVGSNTDTISNCYSSASVTGDYDTGSLVGMNGGTISNSYAEGSVTGTNSTGGLMGYNSGTISNCYATGSVSGGSYYTGGLVGENYKGTISNCYAAGNVMGTGDSTGGLVGDNDGAISASFWDVNTTGQSQSASGKGKTTTEMKTASTFAYAGWGGCWNEGVWTIDDGNDYPRLAWEGRPGQPLQQQLSDLLMGTGIADDPYLIYTAVHLNMIGLFACEWDKHFLLMADVNLAGYAAQSNIIGDKDIPFTGVFDGNDHTISNFTYTTTDTDYIGLFGYVSGPNTVIKDLTLVSPDVNAAGESWYVGSLVGYLKYDGAIIGCSIEGGSVSGYRYTGGLVGRNSGTISNCYSSADVTGSSSTGGLAGYNYGTTSNCYAEGSVTGTDATGGLVGYNYGTTLNCYAEGSVTGTDATGGLVGYNDYGTISNCYATGSVTGDNITGGLVGYSSSGWADHCFWDIETSGQSQSAGGTGKTTAELKTASTFFGWGGCGNDGIWTIDEGQNYPRLSWQNLPGQPLPVHQLCDFVTGIGTAADPYLIYTAEQLNLIGLFICEWDRHFILTDNIDLAAYTGTQFNIIGSQTTPFTGVFDGNGHTISNFTYATTDTDNIGLFGYIDDANAVIRDLTLVTPDVNTTGYSGSVGGLVGWLRTGTVTGCGVQGGSVTGDAFTGGLVGSSSGTISNCYSTGGVIGDHYTGGLVGGNLGPISNCYSSAIVSGYDYTGGLVGSNHDGPISNCFAQGSVMGHNATGGLMGENWGTTSNCYSASSVTGESNTGGLVGYNFIGQISNCYAVGEVSGGDNTGGLVGYKDHGRVFASFWDVNTTGQLSSAGGKGRTTAQMMTASTFLGWGACGNDGIWTIDEGNDYPRLSWENLPGQPLAIQQLGDFLTGSGTAADPYLIHTAEQFNLVGLFICDWDKHFILTDNIDLAGYTGTQFNIIGSQTTPFTGVFDGNDYTISNFTYTTTIREDFTGLFGYVDDPNAMIKDLTLIVPDVNGAGESECVACLVGRLEYGTISGCGIEGGRVTGDTFTGGLVGYSYNGTISNCYAAGSVSGDNYHTGGLVGSNRGVISNCYATGPVMGTLNTTGGLVGNNYGTLENCYAEGSVSGYSSTGGLVGNNYGTLENCYATGSVTGTDDCTGGLVGVNSGMISNCYVTGDVSGVWYSVGGLVGSNTGDGTILNCYAAGSVSGDNYRAGGLVGRNYGTIEKCYATGSVSGNYTTGGLVGHNWESTISNCYAEGSVTGNSCTGGLIGDNYESRISNCYAIGEVSVSGISWQSGHSYDKYNTVVVNGMGYLCVRDHTSSGSFEYDLAAGYWESTTGSLVGYDDGGSYTISFWDSDINPDVNGIGNTTDPNVIGKTTAEMKTESTFTDAGWDFVGEVVNGPNDIWDICEGTNYPKLVWQIPVADLLCPDGVNFIDYSFFAGHWLEDNCGGTNDCEGSDLDQSGAVDINDVKIFAGDWLEGVFN